MLCDVKKLWELGFALGSSLENSIAVDDDRILNPEGLRSSDEFVSHKMLMPWATSLSRAHPSLAPTGRSAPATR